jgi:hypothetical protein
VSGNCSESVHAVDPHVDLFVLSKKVTCALSKRGAISSNTTCVLEEAGSRRGEEAGTCNEFLVARGRCLEGSADIDRGVGKVIVTICRDAPSEVRPEWKMGIRQKPAIHDMTDKTVN